MDSKIERAQRAYELGRARQSALGASPALVYVAGALLFGADRTAPLLGLAMAGFAFVALQIGGSLRRGVGVGFAVGAVPFFAANLAQLGGHACVGSACVSYCMPACLAAGVVSGAVVSRLALKSAGGLSQWSASIAITALAGAMGCRCMGLGSVAGLLLGLGLASLPSVSKLLLQTRARAR